VDPDNMFLERLTLLEEGKLRWCQGEQSSAIKLLENNLKRCSMERESISVLNRQMEINELLYLGKWVGKMKSKPPAFILENYLMKAVQLCERNDIDMMGSAHYQLAKFADEIIQSFSSADDTYETFKNLLADKKAQLAIINSHLANLQSEKRKSNETSRGEILQLEGLRRRLRKEIEIDTNESNQVTLERRSYLHMAISHYLKTLESTNDYDSSIFRLCSLWLENYQDEMVNKMISDSVRHIPSIKFLTLIYQLSARLEGTGNGKGPDSLHSFQRALINWIQRIVVDHPHHTLYQIFALKNSSVNGMNYNSHIASSSMMSSQTDETDEDLKSMAAISILDRLKSLPRLARIIHHMELMCTAYIELANFTQPIPQGKKTQQQKKEIPIERNLQIAKILDLIEIPVTTYELPVNPRCDYSEFPYIVKFKSTLKYVGGINLPKVVQCLGSDGRFYTQLVKGKDDLRQDAILMKLFQNVNIMLKKSPTTRKRDLQIRTYKVVPLTPRTGVLEWVHSTFPIGDYLLQAHPR